LFDRPAARVNVAVPRQLDSLHGGVTPGRGD
jgi:hypothetical protein